MQEDGTWVVRWCVRSVSGALWAAHRVPAWTVAEEGVGPRPRGPHKRRRAQQPAETQRDWHNAPPPPNPPCAMGLHAPGHGLQSNPAGASLSHYPLCCLGSHGHDG